MGREIEVEVEGLVLRGELDDTDCGRAIAAVLPLETAPQVWGDEFWFEIPLDLELDATATRQVEVGTIGYWPPGRALAIFFGPTPLSTGDQPVPASEVNLVGRLEGARRLVREKGAGRIVVRAV